MSTAFYTTPLGVQIRITDRTLDPQERAEKLRRADRRWIFRRVQAHQKRRAAKGDRR